MGAFRAPVPGELPPRWARRGKESRRAAQGHRPPKAGEEKKADEPSRDPNLRFVSISKIVPLPGTYVKDTPREDYKDLIDSIKKSGMDVWFENCAEIKLKPTSRQGYCGYIDNHSIHVQRQIYRIDGEVVEVPLKTKNAYRTLPLSADVIDVLKEQQRKSGDSPYVFPSATGGPISPDSVLHMLHRVLKRAGLPKVRFHDLRHTCAMLALQNGVDIKEEKS